MIKLFRYARIYTPRTGRTAAAGVEQGRIGGYPDGALLVKDGRIMAAGEWSRVEKALTSSKDISKDIKEYDLEARPLFRVLWILTPMLVLPQNARPSFLCAWRVNRIWTS